MKGLFLFLVACLINIHLQGHLRTFHAECDARTQQICQRPVLVVQLIYFISAFFRVAAAPVNCGGPWTDALWDCGQIAGLGRAAGYREVICSQSRDTDQPDTQISISTGETTLDFQEQVMSLCLGLLQLENHLFSTTSEQRLRFEYAACFLVESRPQPCICNRIAPTLSLPIQPSADESSLAPGLFMPTLLKAPTAAPLMHRSC